MLMECKMKNNKLEIQDLQSLEDYANCRNEFRKNVLKHKKVRRIDLGDHISLYFESALTIQYQIQEMLRIEKIFEKDAIREEFDAYIPLIPDQFNLKATMMIEYVDEEIRKTELVKLNGIEARIWMQCGPNNPIYAIPDEDLDRSDGTKTSAVHFLRFNVSKEARQSILNGEQLLFGIDHPNYQVQQVTVSSDTITSLGDDLR